MTAFEQGQADHAAGKPRIPLFARPIEEFDVDWAREWQRGWDAANLAS